MILIFDPPERSEGITVYRARARICRGIKGGKKGEKKGGGKNRYSEKKRDLTNAKKWQKMTPINDGYLRGTRPKTCYFFDDFGRLQK